MVKVKTAQLTGRQLDFATAASVGWGDGGYRERHLHILPEYTTGWMECGGILTEFITGLALHNRKEHWIASALNGPSQVGKSPQEAICRAVVLARLGDEVDIPDELTN
ncbi:hypothetical protein B5P53_06035 [Citrobacter portucalensis]|uniref:DUF2591 domain-containing protein n=1 Tax=Citrobacter portucalensis TaxID=1639133 RepID=UPI0009D51693|nr:DUF2591 domain-containing protein [Citrobacter portucalensis]OPX52439.1 hypothetical protein B5P53_06035 [Citrobacter portucalensis]